MKKINLLMIRSFVGPFFAVFFIANITFVLQIFWLYMDDMIGKGIDIFIVGKLFYYMFLTMTPQSLAIAVMMASIMCFGSLGETFELVAIKSAGISFLKFIRPLFYLSIIISMLSFLFNSYVIPNANLKRNVMMYSIITSSPTFDIQEGVFFTKLKNTAIRIGKKNKKGDKLENILIVKDVDKDEQEVTVASLGKIVVSADKRYFNLHLFDGYYYQQSKSSDKKDDEFSRMSFKKYIKTFDISSFNPIDLNEENFKRNSRVMNTLKVRNQADTIYKRYVNAKKGTFNILNTYFPIHILDSIKANKLTETENNEYQQKLKDFFNTPKHNFISIAVSNIKAMQDRVNFHRQYVKPVKRESNLYMLEFHQRFSWSILCVVFFLIGAPLGAITKKGGIGMPLIISIIAFSAFYFSNSSMVKSVKQDAIHYLVGSWLQVFVFFVFAIIFCYKALNDSNLFSKEVYYRIYISTIGKLIKKKTK